jgi:hypothetical protein
MKPSQMNESNQSREIKPTRQRYQPPAIIYEGKITIRAGSPVNPPAAFGDGPPSPFDFPGQ